MIPGLLRDCPAPAKLNLFLHVTGRRADGYHLLETVFEFIDLQDTLHFERLPGGRIELATPLPDVPPEQDLCVRAARRLAQASGTPHGVRIAVEKRIPMGGGLGGGSSDAATTLMALNRLWDLHWSTERLAAIGLSLGADVPVFLFGQTAYATGIGEVLRPLPLPPRWQVLLVPAVSVPTAGVFAAPELTRNTEPLKIDGLSQGWNAFRGRNDLEPVVLARQPKVAACLEGLRRAGQEVGIDPGLARMTGSGACLFLPLESESVARRVARILQSRRDPEVLQAVHVTRSLPGHPLRDWASGPAV